VAGSEAISNLERNKTDECHNIRWSYDWGVTLKGIEQVSLSTGEKGCLEYIQRNIDQSDYGYLRYLVVRLAAYRNVWWSMANE
jgi:rhamnogalacturonyl hydrolase YesR